MPIEEKPLKLTWTLAAWEDYEYWQGQDRKTLKRINALIKDCLRHPFEGIGKPDKLFVQEGRKVFKEVVPLVAELILAHLKELGLEPAALKRLWLHQANANMNELIARRVLGRDPSPEEAPIILDTYANTSSAGSVIAFHKHREGLRKGDLALLCSFGAGYSAGSVILEKL